MTRDYQPGESPAATLSAAAAAMREEHGPDHKRHEMWAAMADLLDERARAHEAWARRLDHEPVVVFPEQAAAIAVADAYLGAER